MSGLLKISKTTLLSTLILLLASCTDVDSIEGKKMDHSQTTYEHTNKLINENSPYLLAHAHNPVDWYPWGEEALEKAKREDKPIFLSIGYAACHWCHVMERESFENDSIAAILNKHFVSIKVDREQRPDLDHIYMSFTQAITGRGGWPMTVFLTTELKPFFAGTYFPPEGKYGRPGFRELITEISSVYKNDRQKITSSAEDITRRVKSQLSAVVGEVPFSANMLGSAALSLMNGFDNVYGGFGNAPKFPHAVEISLLLRHYKKTGDRSFLNAAEKSLKSMARGGIYDHAGGGFARYSTDQKWLVPHFEKMLYDNALLVPVYAEAFQLTGDSSYLEIIKGTLDFTLREMTNDNGGFYSALDADSEGEEGKFYVWSKKEIDEILGDDSELFCKYYHVTTSGNFEGHNILNLIEGSDIIKNESGIDPEEFDKQMKSGLAKLLSERSKRIRPLTDDKILTSWNGLMLSALCRGYRVTGDIRYIKAAIKNAEFVKRELFSGGKLTHSYREGKHSDGQFLEDYAFYLCGLVELYQADNSDGNSRWLKFSVELAENAADLFMDDKGTLFLRDAGNADLIVRPRDEFDGAIPSAGSYLINALLKIGRLTENNKLTSSGEQGLVALSGFISQRPGSMSSAIMALDFYLGDKIEIVIVGESDERKKIVDHLYAKYMPNALLAISRTGKDDLPLFEEREANKGETTVYLCRNSACRLPVSSLKSLKAELELFERE